MLSVVARSFGAEAIAFCAANEAEPAALMWCSSLEAPSPQWQYAGTAVEWGIDPGVNVVTWQAGGGAHFERLLGPAFRSGAAVRLGRGGPTEPAMLVLGRATEAPSEVFDPSQLSLVAELIAEYPERLRVQAESARHLEETRLLLELTQCTAAALDLEEVLRRCCALLKRQFRNEGCAVLLSMEGSPILWRSAEVGTSHVPDRVHVATGGPCTVDSLEPAILAASPPFARTGRVVFPLVSRDEVLGALVLGGTEAGGGMDARARSVAGAAARQMALAVANARLVDRLRSSCEALQSTRAEMVLRERLAAMGELSAMVAHEVRNPVGVIFNATHRLRALVSGAEEVNTLVDIIHEEGQRLELLTSGLLDFARPAEPVLRDEEVTALMEEALESAWFAEGRRADVRLAVHVAPDVGPVRMDRRLLRQALVNLGVNAIQAMPAGGCVAARAMRISGEDGDVLQLSVCDEGTGIAEVNLSRIFDPFFTTRARGTGLGLAVVKRIVERHGGEIRVDTSPAGSAFIMTLPIRGPQQEAGAQESHA